MNTKLVEKVCRAFFIFVFVLTVILIPCQSAKAQYPIPIIEVNPGDNWVVARGWPYGTTLTLTLGADTVSGIAAPGVSIGVYACAYGSQARYVISDAVTGQWMADFGHFGTGDDEQQLVNLQPGTTGFVLEAAVCTQHWLWQHPQLRHRAALVQRRFCQQPAWGDHC